MSAETADIAALIGSQICHDLISPLGAISNGVELLSLSGAAGGAEIDLISESVQAAMAKIRFFRVAFGAAASGHSIGGAEVASILADLSAAARVDYTWPGVVELDRAEARLIFLLLLCAETALPAGGSVTVSGANGRWQIAATSPKLAANTALFSRLGQGALNGALPAAQVQFLLAPAAAASLNRRIAVDLRKGALLLTV